MADRRMLHKKVVESDPFYGLSEGAQSIYMHLTINADEDGFVNNAQSIAARFKAGQKKLDELVKSRFVLKFGSIYVIKHWRIGNSLKNDRTKPPTYPGIAAAIWVKPNRAYTDHPVEGCKTLLELKTGIQTESNLESKRNPDGIHLESQQNRTEHNRTQMNLTELNPTEPKGNPEQGFEALWMEYPQERRGVAQMAYDAFRQAFSGEEDVETAMRNLSLWKQSEQWNKDEGQYVPYLDNWLARGTWAMKPKKLIPGSAPRELDEDEIAAIRRMMEADFSDEF